MAGDELFAKEAAVVANAAQLLDNGQFEAPLDRAAFAALLKDYQKLFRTTLRLLRLSDRNERELNTLADKQRLAAEEIARKNKALETLSTKLSKYLSPQVYGSIFEGKQEVKIASQRKKLTVLFSDVAGFTETTDQMEPEDLTQLINHYLTEMAQIALTYGATVDKYVGDAIMIFFGDPQTRGVKEDALACVEMAIAMQRRMDELGAIWRDAGIEHPLRCRIGIHTGYCTVGNFGSEDRMDYTIIGGPVNLASRLEHEAPPGGILISYATRALVKDEVHCEAMGPVQIRGIGRPVATYRVVERHGHLGEGLLPIHAELPHLKLETVPALMSSDERRQAATLLTRVLAHLSRADRVEPLSSETSTEKTGIECRQDARRA